MKVKCQMCGLDSITEKKKEKKRKKLTDILFHCAQSSSLIILCSKMSNNLLDLSQSTDLTTAESMGR